MTNSHIYNQIEKMLSTYFQNQAPIDKGAVMELVSKAQYKSYKKGEVLLHAGEHYENVGYVLSGLLRSYYVDKEGNDITKYFHMENQLFMDESLFDYKVSICTYEALEDCRILLLKTEAFKEAVWNNSYLKEVYLAALQEGMKYKIYRENSFLTKSAAERYMELKKANPELEKRAKQAHIATYLGIAPESLSRIKRSIREDG